METSDHILIRGGSPLDGSVPICGAKNSVLKLMAATTLAEGPFAIHNAPAISDVEWMGELLTSMGATVSRSDVHTVEVVMPTQLQPVAAYDLVERMRASILVLGPLLARCGEAQVALPGGDDFGQRPIDMHLRGLEAMGAEFEVRHGNVRGHAENLVGADIILDFPSVGATENILMAAVLAKGTTRIDNAAREPELLDLAAFLNRMGARIVGAGTSRIQVEGVPELHPVEHTAIPDRIEAATYLAAVAVAGGEITLTGAQPAHMDMFCSKLGTMGVRTSPDPDGLWAMSNRRLRSVDVSTLPYPGLATDYKPLFVAMLSVADGVGIVTENIFAGRFRYVDELVRMGADIRTESQHAVVRGVDRLSGAPVRAHDIRAGAALVVAGLAAEGETVIADPDHLDRGYEDLVGKLRAVGADIVRFGAG